MQFRYAIPEYRTEGQEVQDMDLPELYTLSLSKSCGGKITLAFDRPTKDMPDPEKSGVIYAVGGKGGVLQYIGMSGKKNVTERINTSSIKDYRWANGDRYYDQGRAKFKVAVWHVPFNDDRDLEGIEIDVSTFYRAIVGAWPVDLIGIKATNIETVDSTRETWRYARAIIEDMNKFLKVGDNPFLPFIDDVEDNDILQAIANRSKVAHARSFTRTQLWNMVGGQD